MAATNRNPTHWPLAVALDHQEKERTTYAHVHLIGVQVLIDVHARFQFFTPALFLDAPH